MASILKTVAITLKGTSPLLMHRFPMHPELEMKNRPIEEIARAAANRDPDTDELHIPAFNIQLALISAAK